MTDGAWIHVSTEAQGEGQGEPTARARPRLLTPSSRTARPRTPASRTSDIITAIDGQAIDREHPLDLVLLTHAPGDTVTLTVLRDGASQSIEVTLGTRPADAQ